MQTSSTRVEPTDLAEKLYKTCIAHFEKPTLTLDEMFVILAAAKITVDWALNCLTEMGVHVHEIAEVKRDDLQ